MRGRLTVKMRVSRRVAQIRRTVDVDTQRLRKKTIRMLEGARANIDQEQTLLSMVQKGKSIEEVV